MCTCPTWRSHTLPLRQRWRKVALLEPVYNLGSGSGVSVAEIMSAMARVTGVDFTPDIHPRRPGDPARIVALGELAARDLDWQMRHSLDDMVRSAWDARQAAQTKETQG